MVKITGQFKGQLLCFKADQHEEWEGKSKGWKNGKGRAPFPRGRRHSQGCRSEGSRRHDATMPRCHEDYKQDRHQSHRDCLYYVHEYRYTTAAKTLSTQEVTVRWCPITDFCSRVGRGHIHHDRKRCQCSSLKPYPVLDTGSTRRRRQMESNLLFRRPFAFQSYVWACPNTMRP